MATSTATPSVKPIWRSVLSEPEPTPRTAAGSDAIEAAESVGMAKPMPTPMKAMRHMICPAVAEPFSCASRISPTVKEIAPTTAGTRGPMRSARRPALGAMTRATTGITVSTRAARSSE